MALTRNDFTSDGIRTIYPVDFDLGYLRQEFVYVYLEGNEYKDQLSYTWVDSNNIELNTAPLAGVVFSIRRVVPRDNLINDYEEGAILREDNLDDSFLQSLMILQEIQDGYIDPDGTFLIDADIDMNGNRITNLGLAEDADDAITYQQAIDLLSGEGLIGAQPLVHPRQVGDGVNNVFTTPATSQESVYGFFVNIDGVSQRPATDYAINASGNIVFTEAPPNLSEIDITWFQPVTIDGDEIVVTAETSGTQKQLNQWADDIEMGDAGKHKVTAIGTSISRALEERFADEVDIRDFGVVGDGVADDTVAFQNAIDVAATLGFGLRSRDARIKTSGTINWKSNVSFRGSNWGNRTDGTKGVVIIKTGNYIGVRCGFETTVRCDDFSIVNLGVDSAGFSEEGFRFDHCHYFNIDMLWTANSTGIGMHFYYTWTGTIGYLHSILNDKNFRIFFQCNALSIDTLYSSSATSKGIEIGGLLGVNVKQMVHEGSALFGIDILGYTQSLSVDSFYVEANHADLPSPIRCNAVDTAQTNNNINIRSGMIILNNSTTSTVPVVYLQNSLRGVTVDGLYIRLQGTADWSTDPVIQVNNNTLNETAENITISNINIQDETTGGTSTYAVFAQGITTPDTKCFNVTSTKDIFGTFGSYDLDVYNNTLSFGFVSPNNNVNPRFIGDTFMATTDNRAYISTGMNNDDWKRLNGGAEMVASPSFNSSAPWSLSGSGWQIAGGVLDAIFGATGTASQEVDVEVGKSYRVRGNITGHTAGTVTITLGGSAVGAYSANGAFDEVVVASNTTGLFLDKTSSTNLNVTYISVVEAIGSEIP